MNPTTMPEILAPAGGKEQLLAAVRCGADAVYLGVQGFNARQNAENFSDDALKEAVSYCHVRGVRVYITLNTLVFDRELPLLDETIKTIALSGVDAVIVQDFAVASRLSAICSDIPLHASTQMAVHNIAGVRALEDGGFRRAVLARELALDEMKAIRENTSIELECFVHGAHCMSVSGMCFLSAIRGERSGNRGLCAQPCRLNMRAGEREYALSLKDMSLIGRIGELMEAGITSFKIEGRMKRPEYVAAAVTACKEALKGRLYDENTLRSVFSRGGFTDGYLTGQRTGEMFGARTKEDVIASTGVLKRLAALYEKEKSIVPVSARLDIMENMPASLTLSTRKKTVTVTGEFPEKTEGRPLTETDAARFIQKTGGTPFVIGEPVITLGEGLTLSSAKLNALRRTALSALEEKLSETTVRIQKAPAPDLSGGKRLVPPTLRLRVETLVQLPEVPDAEYLYVPFEELLRFPEQTGRFSDRLIAELPALIFPENEKRVADGLLRLRALGVTRASTGNLGGIRLINDAGLTPHGQTGLNILNTLSLNKYQQYGLADTELSFELSFKKTAALGGTLGRGVIGYGYLPLMRFRVCPVKPSGSCAQCSGQSRLIDGKNACYAVLCHQKETMTMYNSVPLYLGDKSRPEVDFVTLYFTVESKEETARIVNLWKAGTPFPKPFTRGLAFREIQ